MTQTQKTDYNSSVGWLPIQGGTKFQTRSGDFVRSEGQDSPEEDFAINIES